MLMKRKLFLKNVQLDFFCRNKSRAKFIIATMAEYIEQDICVPLEALYRAMTGVWPVDTSHHTLLCVTMKNWAKTERAVSQQRSSPSLTTLAKTGGWGGIKHPNEAKNNLDRATWPRQMKARGQRNVNYTGLRCGHDTMVNGQRPRVPSVQLSSHAWHNSPSYHLQLDNFTPSALGAQDTGYICNADLWEDPVSVWTIFFLSDFFTSPHLPGAGASTTTTSGKSEAAPLSMTLTNRDLCGLAGRGAGLWFQCFLSRCREFTFGVSNNISSSWELFSFWSAYGHKMWPCCHYQNTLRGGDRRQWGGN